MKLQLDKQAAVPRTGDREGNGPALEEAKDVYRAQGPAMQEAPCSGPNSVIPPHPKFMNTQNLKM